MATSGKTGDELGQQTETAATPTPAEQPAPPPLRKTITDEQVRIYSVHSSFSSTVLSSCQ